LRRWPIPTPGAQYTSIDYTQVVDDHAVLASIGSVADALDTALAESFVDSHETELIADRVWRSRAQLELATVEYVSWFNHDRLHESLGDILPLEFEALHAPKPTRNSPISVNGSVAAIAPRPANGLTMRRFSTTGADSGLQALFTRRQRRCCPERLSSGRPSRRHRTKRSPPASPTSSLVTLAGTTTRKPTNHVPVKPGPAQRVR
jgi:hypothetical protein